MNEQRRFVNTSKIEGLLFQYEHDLYLKVTAYLDKTKKNMTHEVLLYYINNNPHKNKKYLYNAIDTCELTSTDYVQELQDKTENIVELFNSYDTYKKFYKTFKRYESSIAYSDIFTNLSEYIIEEKSRSFTTKEDTTIFLDIVSDFKNNVKRLVITELDNTTKCVVSQKTDIVEYDNLIKDMFKCAKKYTNGLFNFEFLEILTFNHNNKLFNKYVKEYEKKD